MTDEQASYSLPLSGEGSLASIGRRAVGRIFDNAMFGIPFLVVVIARGWVSFDGSAGLTRIPWWAQVLPVGLEALYETVCYVTWGRTIGKWLAGTRVELGDGRRPGWHAAALRALIPMLAAIVPFIPGLLTLVVYLVALTNPWRQGIHDRAAGTIVVAAPR